MIHAPTPTWPQHLLSISFHFFIFLIFLFALHARVYSNANNNNGAEVMPATVREVVETLKTVDGVNLLLFIRYRPARQTRVTSRIIFIVAF